jgi:hypothetical protein
MSMQIIPAADCIFYVKELISRRLCRTIIENFERDPDKSTGHTVTARGGQGEGPVKLCTDLEISQQGVWAEPHEQVHLAVSELVLTVASQFSSLQVLPLQWTSYKIQRYRKDEGYFKWHFDALGPGAWERQMALIIYLNSVERGGETWFHQQDLKVKPVAGHALLFPTFWTHLHCGEIPRSTDKYIISSYVSFTMPQVAPQRAATRRRPPATKPRSVGNP